MRNYSPTGKPISAQACGILHDDPTLVRVAETEFPNGWWVSTLWIGIDHRFGAPGPPLIFETMVFDEDFVDQDSDHYSTRAQALAGHERMVNKWLKSHGLPEEPKPHRMIDLTE